MSTAHRWTIFDPSTNGSITFPMNPKDMKLPSLEKSITEEPTAAGRVILWEGPDRAQKLSFDGTALTLAHLTFLEVLWNTRRQVRLTDDFGRQWWIYPSRLERSRPRTSRTHPERHTYTFEAYVLDWP